MKTNCNGCHYAQMDGVQIGCELGRIDLFKKYHKVTHDEYFTIHGRVCNAYNDTQYIPPPEVYKHIALPYDLYIISDNISLIEKSMRYSLTLEPQNVRVAYSGPWVSPLKNCEFNYFVEKTPYHEMEFQLTKRANSSFYVQLIDGETVEDKFIQHVDHIYNIDLTPFVAVEGSNRLYLARAVFGVGGGTEEKGSLTDRMREVYGEDKILS